MPRLPYILRHYNFASEKLYDEIKIGLESANKVLSRIPSQQSAHRGTFRQVSSPNVLDTTTRRYEAIFKLDWEAILQTDAKKFAEALFNYFEQIHTQQTKHFFDIIEQVSSATGNNFNAKDKNVWDVYLEMIEATEMEFDDEGKPCQEIWMNPETAKKISQHPQTNEQLQKGKAIMEKKKREFYAKKRTRRLS